APGLAFEELLGLEEIIGLGRSSISQVIGTDDPDLIAGGIGLGAKPVQPVGEGSGPLHGPGSVDQQQGLGGSCRDVAAAGARVAVRCVKRVQEWVAAVADYFRVDRSARVTGFGRGTTDRAAQLA